MATASNVPFVGPSYQLSRKKADTQQVINMYPSPVESGSGKSQIFLKSIPGLKEFGKIVTYYTSTIFPLLIEENLVSDVPLPLRGYSLGYNDSMGSPVASLQSGSLAVSINYKSYTNQRDVNPDTMTQAVLRMQSGNLETTISYKSYTADDSLHQPVGTLRSGDLNVVISYINYQNQRDVNPDVMHQSVSTIVNGTLA